MNNSKYTEGQVKFSCYAGALSHEDCIQFPEILSKRACCLSGYIADDLPIARSTLSQHLSELS